MKSFLASPAKSRVSERAEVERPEEKRRRISLQEELNYSRSAVNRRHTASAAR